VNYFKVLSSLPAQLIAVIISVTLLGSYFPLSFMQTSLTFSLIFKELLNALLPFIVFTFISTGILALKKNAPVVLALMLGVIFFSNGLAATLVYLLSRIFVPLVSCQLPEQAIETVQCIEPFFKIHVPVIAESVTMLKWAIGVGLIGSLVEINGLRSMLNTLKTIIEQLMSRLFIPLLPLYILGFLIDLRCKGTLGMLVGQYGKAVMVIVALQLLYLFFMYLVAADFSPRRALVYIQHALPSYLTAFSTMSSAATIPVTLNSAKKNIPNHDLADMAVPIMANVHLVGDSISTPMLALVTLMVFKGCLPAFVPYCFFVLNFCTNMFAVSGIPGGGILVMIPILSQYLGFDDQMNSVITALYFLMDSFGTAANVMGDGALVIIVNRILKKLRLI